MALIEFASSATRAVTLLAQVSVDVPARGEVVAQQRQRQLRQRCGQRRVRRRVFRPQHQAQALQVERLAVDLHRTRLAEGHAKVQAIVDQRRLQGVLGNSSRLNSMPG